MLQAFLDLKQDPSLVGRARTFVRSTLSSWDFGQCEDDACLVASELVTNAILHGRTPIQLRLLTDGAGSLQVEVRDEGGHLPVSVPNQPGSLGGRGLHLVEGVAAAWGVRKNGVGKVVWALLPVSPIQPA